MSNTPSWLQINDGNFKELLDYLQENVTRKNDDPFYSAACELLDGRVERLVPVLADSPDSDAETTAFRIRLLGAWLLCYPEPGMRRNTVFLCLLAVLSQMDGDAFARGLFDLSLRSLSIEVERVGFGWGDLTDLTQDIIRHKTVQNTTFGKALETELWYAGKGLLRIVGGQVFLASVNMKTWTLRGSGMVESMKMFEDRIGVLTAKDDRLKQSESCDIASIDRFTCEFRRSQRGVVTSDVTLKRYSDGQTVVVKISDTSPKRIMVETVDPNYEKVRGEIVKGKGWYFYNEKDLDRALKKEDYVKVTIVDREMGQFSISDTFLEAMMEESETGRSYPCEYVFDSKSGPLWMTNTGVPLYVKDSSGYREGDRAYVRMTFVDPKGYIAGRIEEDQSGIEEEDFVDYKGWFIANCIRLDGYAAPQRHEARCVSREVVRIFERSMYNYQKSLSRASEIYKMLCFCQMLAELTEDERELHYLELKASYLEQLVYFTKGQYTDMVELAPSSDIAGEHSVGRCVNIVRILREILTRGDSKVLSDMIHNGDDGLVVKLARILQSYNRIKDIVPEKTLVELKMEMIKELSLDSETLSSLDDEEEEYLGMEDKTKEFKTSFVFPPDRSQHMSANLQMQSRNVFRAVCAFLNSMTGGTVYLGVNDGGYVAGLDNDLNYTKGSMDGYIRLIQDEAKRAFEQSVLDYLDFEVMFDGRVVAIRVRPYADGLVYMDRVPYKRNFGESEPMREDERARMLSAKMSLSRTDGSLLGVIEKAVHDRKVVCLKRYSSSNSIRDRRVEPFKIVPGGRFVWCYDLDDGKCKQFSLSRAADVVVLNEPWSHEGGHRALETDIFNWSGEKAMHIELQMDNLACNILKDEYPVSGKYLTSINDGAEWILSTDVYRSEAPGRFVIGLLDHVKILQGDELKDFVDSYIRRHVDSIRNI